jgi:hypothetical protein
MAGKEIITKPNNMKIHDNELKRDNERLTKDTLLFNVEAVEAKRLRNVEKELTRRVQHLRQVKENLQTMNADSKEEIT